MMRKLFWLAALAPALACAAEIPVADFARDEEMRGPVKISPDGKYVAEIRLEHNNDYLAVVRLSDRKISAGLKLGDERRVSSYWWAGDTVILSFGEKFRTLKQPQWTGELVSFDAESSSGRPMRYIFGGRTKTSAFVDRVGEVNPDEDYFSGATVVRDLPGDPNHVMIEVNDYRVSREANPAELRRVDLRDGSSHLVAQAPLRGRASFLADSDGNARYVQVEDDQLQFHDFIKTDPQGDWKPLTGPEMSSIKTDLLLVSSDDKRGYLLSYAGGNSYCLVEQMLDGSSRKKIACDPSLDISYVIMSFDKKEPIAALYGGAAPWERILPTSNPDAGKLKELMKAFPGQIVNPFSASTDGSEVILYVHSDRSPGDYYLFEPKTKHADLLASRRDWIDPDQMSEVRPLEFKARDGQVLHGLLTVPHGKEAKNLPLVVHPHGGPFDEMDGWFWDQETQLLASRGYAVLQVNFRGSAGYGQQFSYVARRHWGGVMIDDIADGVQWVLQQGIADSSRMCIFGGSYGAYAALMSAEREPDLYRCVVGYAGVYDLNRLISDSDMTDSWSGLSYVKEFIGADAEHLKADSPINYVDRLKAAIMIVHGDDDLRAPMTQATALRSALDARHYPYEWVVKTGEGHGFYLQEDRLEFYNKLLAFLDKNIGTAKAGESNAASAAAVDAKTADAK